MRVCREEGRKRGQKQLWILFCSPSCVRPNYSVIAERAWGGGGGGVGRESFPEKKGNFRTTPDISRGGERPTEKRGETLFSPPLLPLVRRGETEKEGLFIILPPLFFYAELCVGRGKGESEVKLAFPVAFSFVAM